MLSITQISTGSAAQMQRMLTDATKAALEEAIEYWHATYLPLHFTEQGFTRYHYQLRKGQDEPNLLYSDDRGTSVRTGRFGRLINNPHYYWRKWRRYRTHDPLVLTGASRAAAQQSIRVSARAIDAGVTIRGQGVMDLPKYFYQFRKDQGAPDKVDELLRTTPDEDADLTRFYNAAVTRHLAISSAPPTTSRIA